MFLFSLQYIGLLTLNLVKIYFIQTYNLYVMLLLILNVDYVSFEKFMYLSLS